MMAPDLTHAIDFAVAAHRGQYRDGDHPLPYITHPLDVLVREAQATVMDAGRTTTRRKASTDANDHANIGQRGAVAGMRTSGHPTNRTPCTAQLPVLGACRT